MKPSKALPLLIILILTVPTALMFNPVAAATKPSVPEFTAQYIDRSYDVASTYGPDPYTGQTVVKTYGYHVDNRTIDVTVTNQQFTPYLDSNNKTVGLYYNVRSKGHFESWYSGGLGAFGVSAVQASSSGNTVITCYLQNSNVPTGGQIDFQVEAVAGYPAADANYCGSSHFTTVDESGWSGTQTITVGNSTVSTPTSTPFISWIVPTETPYPTAIAPSQQNPTATPIQPGTQSGTQFGSDWQQTVFVVMAAVIAVLVIVVLGFWRRNAHK